MHRVRMAAFAAVISCAVMLAGAATASAQTGVPLTGDKVAMTGTNKGKDFAGTFTIDRFEERGGKLYAVGTLKGTLKNRRVTRHNVAIPAALTGDDTATASQNRCRILKLELGPLDLNLLGLRVQLNKVVLEITAEPGPGNLLGNLLCAIAGLLDRPALEGPLSQIAAILNAILAILRGL